MNEITDIERLLSDMPPCVASPDLRDRVLRAVAAELQHAPPGRPWQSRADVRFAMTAAAALFVGVLLNVWALRSDQDRQARLCGARPLPREIREEIQMAEATAGPAGAAYVRHQLLTVWHARRRTQVGDVGRYQQWIQQVFHAVLDDSRLPYAQEDPEMDGDHPDRDARSALDGQRHVRLA